MDLGLQRLSEYRCLSMRMVGSVSAGSILERAVVKLDRTSFQTPDGMKP